MIDENDKEMLRTIFVTKDECEKKKLANSEAIKKLEISMAQLNTKLSIALGILSAIGSSMLIYIFRLIFGGF